MKKFKDIKREDVSQFFEKLIWFNGTGRGNLRETTIEFWDKLVAPELENIISITTYVFNRTPEEIITEEKVIIGLAFGIVLSLEINNQIKINGEDSFWDSIEGAEDVLKKCTENNPKFEERLKLIAEEISSNAIAWIQSNEYIIETELSKINYTGLEDFLNELVDIKRAKEADDKKELLDGVKESLNMAFNLIARRFRIENECEENDPQKFICGLLKNLAYGSLARKTVKDIVKKIESSEINLEVEEGNAYYKKTYVDSPEYFNYLKNLLGPGIIWWVKENFPNHPDIKLENIKETFNDYDN